MTQHERDLLNLAELYVPVTICPGGRATHSRYICHICGHDYTSELACGAPTRLSRKEMAQGDDGLWRHSKGRG